MTAGWETKPLGEVCQFRGGGTPSKQRKDFWNGSIPWVSPKDMKSVEISDSIDHITDSAIKSSATTLIPSGSILLVVRSGILARTVPIGITSRELAVNQDLKALVPGSDVDPWFLYYALKANEQALLATVTRGATVHRLSSDVVKSLRIPLPPLEEQKRIVAILDAAFADIDQLSWNVVRKLATADELFESILEAALDGVTDGWPETTLAVEVNEGHCDLLAGFAFKSKEYSNVEGDVRLLRGDNIAPGSLRWDGVKRIATDRFEEFERYELREDDIVLAMDRPWVSAGLKLAVVAPNDLPALLVQRVARLRFGPTWDPMFAQYTLRQRRFSDHLLSAQTGVGVPHISASQIKEFSIWKPPVTVQREVGRRVRAAQEHCAQVRDRAVTARSDTVDLRQSLLHQAFTGQL